MYLKSLYLSNFRNYKEAEFSFCEGPNIIYGNNAQGKTNLLEAIHFIATGKSFRTQSPLDLIRSAQKFFFLEAEIFKDQVFQKIQIHFDGQVKRLHLGGNSYSSFHPLLGTLPIVLYTPCDIELILGAPQERRRFLNLHLAQSDPLYVHHLSRFWRAMKQRNCLLKSKNIQTIECWEMEMVSSAEYIGKARERMVQEIQIQDLAGEKHELFLQSSASKSYLRQLQKNRIKEMELGLTLAGPHRDDLQITIEGKLAKLFASEGQKKTAIAALKLAEWERLSRQIGAPALIGFDDLDSSLDAERQQLIRAKLSQLGQVFITTPHEPKEEGHHIHISKWNR